MLSVLDKKIGSVTKRKRLHPQSWSWRIREGGEISLKAAADLALEIRRWF